MIVPMKHGPAAAQHQGRKRRDLGNRLLIATAWTVVMALHSVGLLFFGVSSYSYWILWRSSVQEFLEVYRIGISPRHYHSVAVVYGIVAVIHAVFIAQILVLSVRHQHLVLADQVSLSASRTRHPVMRVFVWIYSTFFTPTGLLGVNGPCFDLLIFVREVIETSLQTVQAYRMSQFLARVWLNRFYVTLLVLNCWLMALVHAIFHRTPTTKYFAILLSDFALDFVSSLVVPSILVLIYYDDMEFTSGTLFGIHWFEDVWVINAASEFQLILVVSWTDVAIRMVFALSMLGNMNTLKRFVNVVAGAASRQEWMDRWNAIVPESRPKTRRENFGITSLVKANSLVKDNVVLTRSLRIAFAVWGTAVLAFHLSADSDQIGSHCVMQARPWGVSRPSCKLVLIDCYEEEIQGAADEVDEKISNLYAPSLSKIILRHCPALDIPSRVKTFSNLVTLKIYNSTIKSWNDSAALTQTNHPIFSILMLVRVDLDGGTLPPGLQSTEFPQGLTVVGIIHSNLIELPNDLDAKWPHQLILHVDTTRLDHIPQSLLRLQPTKLVIAGNPIEKVPAELFKQPDLNFLDLSYTGISALPTDVDSPSDVLTCMNIDGTNVSYFPEWIDKWLKYPGDLAFSMRLSAASSPYCSERNAIFQGLQENFSTPALARDSGSSLMNSSKGNWAFLEKTVSCTPSTMYRYPLLLEDYFNMIV